MRRCPVLASVLWAYYEAWRDNGFKSICADGTEFRPRPSISRLRRVKDGDYGARMSLLHDGKEGSVRHADRLRDGRPPNRRGEGPSHEAAVLVKSGTPLEDAARRLNVTEASVIRALRFQGNRVG